LLHGENLLFSEKKDKLYPLVTGGERKRKREGITGEDDQHESFPGEDKRNFF